MSKIIYWTKKGKFESDVYREIPWDELHSSNEETPALILLNGTNVWFYEGKQHRLIGPAFIYNDGRKCFWLNGKYYDFKDWLKTPKSR